MAAPIGVNASAPWPPNFSAMVRTPSIDISRMVPCRKSDGPSMITASRRVPPWCASLTDTSTSTRKAATRPTSAMATCSVCRIGARGERLDEHAHEGSTDDDQHRGDRAVVDVGHLEGGRRQGGRQARAGEGTGEGDCHGGHYFVLPSAEVGAGSVTPTYCRVLATAGLSRSSAGFG